MKKENYMLIFGMKIGKGKLESKLKPSAENPISKTNINYNYICERLDEARDDVRIAGVEF